MMKMTINNCLNPKIYTYIDIVSMFVWSGISLQGYQISNF